MASHGRRKQWSKFAPRGWKLLFKVWESRRTKCTTAYTKIIYRTSIIACSLDTNTWIFFYDICAHVSLKERTNHKREKKIQCIQRSMNHWLFCLVREFPRRNCVAQYQLRCGYQRELSELNKIVSKTKTPISKICSTNYVFIYYFYPSDNDRTPRAQ